MKPGERFTFRVIPSSICGNWSEEEKGMLVIVVNCRYLLVMTHGGIRNL